MRFCLRPDNWASVCDSYGTEEWKFKWNISLPNHRRSSGDVVCFHQHSLIHVSRLFPCRQFGTRPSSNPSEGKTEAAESCGFWLRPCDDIIREAGRRVELFSAFCRCHRIQYLKTLLIFLTELGGRQCRHLGIIIPSVIISVLWPARSLRRLLLSVLRQPAVVFPTAVTHWERKERCWIISEDMMWYMCAVTTITAHRCLY